MDKLVSMKKKGNELLEEFYTPYKHLTVKEICEDPEIDNIYEKYAKCSVIVMTMIFLNMMMLSIELTKQGSSFILNKYHSYIKAKDYDVEEEEEEEEEKKPNSSISEGTPLEVDNMSYRTQIPTQEEEERELIDSNINSEKIFEE